MTETRGLEDVLEDVVRDLRTYDPLLARLPEAEAVYEGLPQEDRDYPVSVTITPIYDGSENYHGQSKRVDYRVQVTVTATDKWRREKDRESGTTAMSAQYAILDDVADRLDQARGSQELPLGSETGPTPQPMESGRVAVIGDWRIRGFYTTDEQ